ncbi:hypothetical protein [Streptomyces rubiginosohelvolus]
MIHPDNERRMAQRMNPPGHRSRRRHASLASQPQAVVDLIEDAVRETAG